MCPFPQRPARERGFGLVQALVLLLLVASALGAGLVLLQSRRGVEQTRTQEDSLRWAQQAVTAFAAANSRLPCPAPTLDGDEDCSPGMEEGWLPLRTLAGASGTAPGIGPVRYVVYRGEAEDHLDLTQPLNAYLPLDLKGEPRTYEKEVEADDGTTSTEESVYEAVNGLDFCQALGLASVNAAAGLAGTSDRSGLPLNIAYGLAAAGPNAGPGGRFDDANAGGNLLESPWRASDSGYDDRVRVQTFAEVAHAVGCRLVADATYNTTPYNVATASVDALAAAVTLHDSVGDLQENNIGNAEAAVRDAGFAQAMAAAQVLLAAGHIADTVSSNVLAVTELIRAIGTCIASLGTTCWEVPIKASAIAMEVASIISYGTALGVNIATVTLAAVALNKAIEVRERAQNAVIEPATDVEEAAEKVCVAAHGGTIEKRVVVKRDANGNIIWKRDGSGRQLFDENGNPLYEYEVEYNVWQDGLKQQMEQARDVYVELVAHTDSIYQRRILPFSESQIRYRIDEGKSIDLYGGNYYRKAECEAKADGEWHKQGETCVQRFDDKGQVIKGGYERVFRFDWNKAIADAIAKRRLAEAWSDANRAASEAQEIWEKARDNYNQWADTLLPAMITQQNQDCAKVNSGSAEDREKFKQVCENDRAAVLYTQTCRKLDSIQQPDGSVIQRETVDTDPDAPCLPQLARKRDQALAAKNNAAAVVANAKTAYDNQRAPYFNYPSDWSYWTLVEDGKTALGNPRYLWKQNDPRFVGINVPPARPPYYAVDQHNLLETNTDIHVWECYILGNVWSMGTLCQRYPYSRAYNDYRTARIASDEAKENYDSLEDQYTMMSARCDALRNLSNADPDSAEQANLAIGAEEILRLADRRGSVGPQPGPDASGSTP